MYILFDKETKKEAIRYFIEVPERLYENFYVIEVEQIPKKEGFAETATLLKGNKIHWDYEELEQIDPDQ